MQVQSSIPAAGVILIVATCLEILAMAHHPSVTTPDVAMAIAQIAALAKPAAIVHGVLMALMLSVAFCLSEFALQRGWGRPLIRAGGIVYAAGVGMTLGAALMSGFVMSDLARLTHHVTSFDLEINGQLLVLCRVLNQACANAGAVAMSAGIVVWSVDLLLDGGTARVAQRIVGTLGCLVGALSALALMFGALSLDVHGASRLLLVQALWNVGVGVLLFRAMPAATINRSGGQSERCRAAEIGE